jgi:hypothetical protein
MRVVSEPACSRSRWSHRPADCSLNRPAGVRHLRGAAAGSAASVPSAVCWRRLLTRRQAGHPRRASAVSRDNRPGGIPGPPPERSS